MQSGMTATLTRRALGAAKLDVATYEEVEADESATNQAAIIVALAAVSTGIGLVATDGGLGFFGGIFEGILGWIASAAAIWFIGTKFLAAPETSADIGQVLRTLGFASTPTLLAFTGVLPVIGPFLSFIVGVWALVATFTAIRCALEMSNGRAIVTTFLGLIAAGIAVGIIALILGIGAYGLR